MSIMQQSAAITIVLVLLWIALWWLKRSGVGAFTGRLRLKDARKDMEVLQRLTLAPQHSLQLIRVQERNLLIAVHPGGLAVLCELDTRRL